MTYYLTRQLEQVYFVSFSLQIRHCIRVLGGMADGFQGSHVQYISRYISHTLKLKRLYLYGKIRCPSVSRFSQQQAVQYRDKVMHKNKEQEKIPKRCL